MLLLLVLFTQGWSLPPPAAITHLPTAVGAQPWPRRLPQGWGRGTVPFPSICCRVQEPGRGRGPLLEYSLALACPARPCCCGGGWYGKRWVVQLVSQQGNHWSPRGASEVAYGFLLELIVWFFLAHLWLLNSAWCSIR